MDGTHPSLSLILPAYNEQAGLRQAIIEADEALTRLCDDYEILVVDDGSGDDTFAIATDEASRRPHVRVIRHPRNRGYGAALRTGFDAARCEFIAFTDADCQFYLDDLALLFPLTDQAPIVVGHRLDRKDPWRRRFLSRGYNLLARTFLGTTVRDIDCALKLFRRDVLTSILPESRGFFVNTEILTQARMHGIEVAEVGVRHRPRTRGTSSVSLREVPRTLAHLLPFWWSRVLFAGKDTPESREASSPGFAWLGLLLVLVVAGLLFFSRLRAPLLEPQEVRYAEIPRQMLAEQTWLVPRLHGEDYLDKPPLFYWSVMASYRLFGVGDWSARVVVGMVGLLIVLVTYYWGSRVFDSRAGLYSALVLCLMPGFVYRARMLTFDTLLTLWVVAGLASAHLALHSGRLNRGWWLLSAVFCGLGLLTKGPVALVLIAVPLFVLSLLDPRLARPSWRGWGLYLTVAAGLAAPWFVAIMQHESEFAGYFFWKHHVERFVDPFDHAKPVWYYMPGLLIGVLPWWFPLAGLVGVLAVRRGEVAWRRPGALGFALVSFLWTIVFFSAAGCKRPTYILPAMPCLALAIGWYLHAGTPIDLWRRVSRQASLSAGLVLGTALILTMVAIAVEMVPPRDGWMLASVTLAGLAILVVQAQRITWAHSAAMTFGLSLVGVQVVLPGYIDQFSLRGQLRRLAGTPERDGRAIVCYPQRFDSASFYLPHGKVQAYGPHQQRELIAHLKQNPGTLLLVKSGRALDSLLAELPPGIEYHTLQQRAAIQVGRVIHRQREAEFMLARQAE